MIYEQILEQLSFNNCKLTLQRRELLKIMVRAKTHLSAREVFERMRLKYPSISFDTVYRNLALFRDIHIINELDFQDGRSRYELNRHHDHHHHLVCLKCGGAWEIPGCPLQQHYINKDVPDNFKVINHRFEIFGYCRECQTGPPGNCG